MIQNKKSPQDLGFELANLLLCATVRLPNYRDDVHLNNHNQDGQKYNYGDVFIKYIQD